MTMPSQKSRGRAAQLRKAMRDATRPIIDRIIGEALDRYAVEDGVPVVPPDPSPMPDPDPAPQPDPQSPGYGPTLFVSVDGRDDWPGTLEQPMRGVEAAFRRLPDGQGGAVLLRRGDTFTEGTPRFDGAGGHSPTERVVIGAYGDPTLPLPKLTNGLLVGNGQTPKPLRHLLVRDIDLSGSSNGLSVLREGEDVVIEGIRIVGGPCGLAVQAEPKTARLRDVAIRKCLIADLSAPPEVGHVQGIYCFGIDGLELADNVVDNCGQPGDVFRHNVYIQNGCTSVAARGNVFARASSHGIQMRSGGVLEGNLFLFNPIHASLGGGVVQERGGVEIWVHGNVLLGGGDISPAQSDGRGFGFWADNLKSGACYDNVFADGTGRQRCPLKIEGDEPDETGYVGGVHNFLVQANVRLRWPCDPVEGAAKGYVISGTPEQLSGTSVSGMDERDDLAGVDLSLETLVGGTGTLIWARLRSRQVTAPQVIADVRRRLGLA